MRYTKDMTATFSSTVLVDGVATDSDDITFTYKIGVYGEEFTVTPTRQSVGVYSASIIPDRSGNLYYRWDTDGTIDVAREGVLNIAWSAFV